MPTKRSIPIFYPGGWKTPNNFTGFYRRPGAPTGMPWWRGRKPNVNMRPYHPPIRQQGAREVERRKRQIERGLLQCAPPS